MTRYLTQKYSIFTIIIIIIIIVIILPFQQRRSALQ